LLDKNRKKPECIGMQETQGAYIYQDDIRGMDVHMGIEGTNSYGHGEGKGESMNFTETIKFFQKDVQCHKGDNENIMKAKEQQDEFNINLMQSFDIIENNIDKENGSRKTRSHRSSDE
jgi:hypothetical protein